MCEQTRILGVDRNGAFAEYVAVPESVIWKNDRTKLPPEIATLQEPFGNAVFATGSQDLAGRSVAVLGCGPIGLFTIGIARASGAAAVLCRGPHPVPPGPGEAMGATDTLNVQETDDVPGWFREQNEGFGVDIVFEMSGSPRAITDAFKIVRNGGRVILFGIPSRPVEIDVAEAMIFKNLSVLALNGRRIFETWYKTRWMLESGVVDLRPLITHRYDLEKMDVALQQLQAGEACKIILYPGRSPRPPTTAPGLVEPESSVRRRWPGSRRRMLRRTSPPRPSGRIGRGASCVRRDSASSKRRPGTCTSRRRHRPELYASRRGLEPPHAWRKRHERAAAGTAGRGAGPAASGRDLQAVQHAHLADGRGGPDGGAGRGARPLLEQLPGPGEPSGGGATPASRDCERYGAGTGLRALHLRHVRGAPGAGAGASRAFVGTEAALTYVSCWNANEAVIPTLTDPNTVILSDALNHASIIDAIRLSRPARKVIYQHSDMGELRAGLQSCEPGPAQADHHRRRLQHGRRPGAAFPTSWSWRGRTTPS